MFTFGTRSLANLSQVDPRLILVVSRGLLYTPIDFMVTEGLRLWERHKMLIAEDRSWTTHSKHLMQPDGFAHAIDIMAVGDIDGDGDIDAKDKDRTWDRVVYGVIADRMLRASKEFGYPIRWGGHFKHRFDGPHFELV